MLYLLGISFQASSQSPGYMGKHVSAGYGAYMSPGAISSNDYTVLNYTHEAFLEFAVSKNASLGLSAKYYNTGVDNSGEMTGMYFTNGTHKTVTGEPRGDTHVRGLNYMCYAKLFRKRFLAPWGKYFMIGATLNTYVASYDPDKVYVTYTSYTNNYNDLRIGRFSDFGPERQSYVKFDLVFGNGRSRIIADRIILDYGYNINVWAATTLIDDLLSRNNKRVSADEYIDMISSKRVRGVNRFNVFLKVGVLLF